MHTVFPKDAMMFPDEPARISRHGTDFACFFHPSL